MLYEGLEKKLREVFTERTGILRQLSKTSKELDSIKGNLQSFKNEDAVPKKDVQRILELSHKQRDEMKSLQAALQKQLDDAAERAEKQQATIKFLKMEMEKKTKIIKDLQQENKSLKNKLLSGTKLCDIHTEESKKIQAQLKELRYGKKDLIFKGQQLMDLENKLKVAKDELEKAALDKESQLKALKDTVHICFSSVLHSQTGSLHRFPATPSNLLRYSALLNNSRVTFQQPHAKSKKIQAQLKELRYGKKDLIFKGQQLMDLENKLKVAKDELEKAALDKESQLKALKDTVHICFSSVLHSQTGSLHRFPATPSNLLRYSALLNNSRVTFQQPHAKDIPKVPRITTTSKLPLSSAVMRRESTGPKDCQMVKVGAECSNQTESSSEMKKTFGHSRTPEQIGQGQERTAEEIGKTDGDLKKTQMDKHN
ncbi:leucine zipper protein [Pimephales promelas]|nr:leucine zipper protein [Pimephales promelas]